MACEGRGVFGRAAGESDRSANAGKEFCTKTVLTESLKLDLEILCDRRGRFDPMPIAKLQRRMIGVSDKVISMRARGKSWCVTESR